MLENDIIKTDVNDSSGLPQKSMHDVRHALDKTGTDIQMIQYKVQRCMDDGSKHL